MSCRELQFLSSQRQWFPEAPTASLWGWAGFASESPGLMLAQSQELHVQVTQQTAQIHSSSTESTCEVPASCVDFKNQYNRTRTLLLPDFWANGRTLKVNEYVWNRYFEWREDFSKYYPAILISSAAFFCWYLTTTKIMQLQRITIP